MQILDISYNNSVKNAIHIAKSISREFFNDKYNSAHLLKALLHKDVGLEHIFSKINADIYYIEEWCEVRIEALPRITSIPDKILGDKTIEAVFHEADSIKLKLLEEEITPAALLISVCTPGVGFSYEQLKTLSITAEDIYLAAKSSSSSSEDNSAHKKTSHSKKNTSIDLGILDEYCIDMTKASIEKCLPSTYGRDAELKMIIEILGRHLKPNVLITGEAGVGKTALLHAFTNMITNGSVPEQLKRAKIYELNFIHLVSGAAYKSEVEDRLKKIFKALKEFEKPVLLIDELNNITDKDSGYQNLTNILKSELAANEITFIATATNDLYRKHIEIDPGLSRRFENVSLEEPSEEDTLKMITNTILKYENHHNLKISNSAIAEAIRLSKRYSKNRSLPDSAIDLIDRTMSACCFMTKTTASNVAKIKNDLNKLQESDKTESEKTEDLKWYWRNLKNVFSYLLFTELKDEDVLSEFENSTDGFKKIDELLSKFSNKSQQEKEYVSKNDISATISNKTGIPVGKLQADEKEKLLTIEDHLKTRLIGQDHAIKTIAEAVIESRSGLSKPGLPIGSFFLTGPTGTGKTELAKALADFLFQSEDAIIRFDMSEFKEEHSAALLYGAPPGYVGYEEGGVLVNKIRHKPYSIVLFDEIEKAHPSVFDIFLQILDEGKLNDRLGKTGYFSNAVILFTSNIASNHVVSSFEKGSIPESSSLLELMANYFRPEFLGRLTEIVPFAPITKNNIVKIFNLQMKDLYEALEKQEITLELTDKAKEYLAFKGFTPKYGARPLRGVIRNELRSPLSRKLITEEIQKGSFIKLDIIKEKLIWEHI